MLRPNDSLHVSSRNEDDKSAYEQEYLGKKKNIYEMRLVVTWSQPYDEENRDS